MENNSITKININEAYEQALSESGKYLQNPLGIITDDPTSQSDKRFVRQNNTIIALLTSLHNKLDNLKIQQEIHKKAEIDELIQGMKKLQISSDKPLVRKRSTIFSYYK